MRMGKPDRQGALGILICPSRGAVGLAAQRPVVTGEDVRGKAAGHFALRYREGSA